MLKKPDDRKALTATCQLLQYLGQQRARVIRRQQLVDLPALAGFKGELLHVLGRDHGLTPKQLYTQAGELRKVAMKTLSREWPEFQSLLFAPTPSAQKKAVIDFDRRMTAECQGQVEERFMGIISALAMQCAGDQQSLALMDRERILLEKRIETAAQQLPVCEWWCEIDGCAAGGLGKVIGNTGDLHLYANPGKVWKRLGLAPFKGQAASQWRKQKTGLTKEEWVELGYNPVRRSDVYTIGDALVKNGTEYREIFIERKRREFEKAREEGLEVATTTKATADAWEKLGLPRPLVVKKFDSEKHRAVAHVNLRSQRYMEKRLIRELWKAWRDA